MSNRAPRLVRSPRRFAVATLIATIGLTPAAAMIGAPGASAAPPAVAAVKTGSQGSEVRQVQQALADRGFLSDGDVDGIFGAKTTDAVKRFQASQGLTVDGVVGDVTSIALGLTSSRFFGLSTGDTGAKVTALQKALKSVGFDPGAADGVYGSATKYAVSAFQRSLAYLQTGEMNAATAAALEARTGGSSGDSSGSGDDLTDSNSSTTNSINFKSMRLSIGSKGKDVKKVQNLLISLKYDVVGGADGIYGGMTANAVRAFQRDNGLYIDAIIGPNTAAALQRASEGGGSSPTPSSGSILGLKTGSTGAAVKTLQNRLLEIGVPLKSKVDGIYGPATAAAVRLFQSWNGLEQTGAIGPKTKAALDGAKKSNGDDSKPSGDIGYAVYGENSTRVTALQNKLVSAGIKVPGGVDGIFGSGTASAVMSFQRAKSLNVTGVVSKATASKLGLKKMDRPAAPKPAPKSGGGYIKVFPVQGWCGFSDTWGAYRSGGRSHIGTDIIAASGKQLYAIDAGVIEKLYNESSDRLAGNGVRLRLADGTYAFYAHMSQLGPGIGVGTRVSAGQVVGYVGSTGNAYTPHLHFEIHPKGGAAVNPYPYLKAVNACNVTTPR